MDTINIFLEALSNRLPNLDGKLVAMNYMKPTQYNAYKYYCIEVQKKKGLDKEIICEKQLAAQYANKEEVENIKKELSRIAIEELLKIYGI